MKKTILPLLAVLLLVLLALQGCALQVQNQTQTPVAASAQLEPVKPAADINVSPSISPSASQSPEETSATGVYQGQADNNFIEIKIAGQPEDKAYMAFMLTGEIKDNFEGMKLETGDKVEIKYYRNASGQLVLTGLARTSGALPSANAKTSATGVYQGQADNNFIEIKIAGQPEDKAYMVFMLTGEIKDNFGDMNLETGDKVQLKYYKNDFEQLVLTELVRTEK